VSRDLQRENVALRQRLRDTETRLRLLAAAVAADDVGARTLARMLLSGSLDTDGVSQWPPSITSGEPEARSLPHQE